MIVGVLTTCHTQYTSDSSICVFLFNRTTLTVFVTYLTGAPYMHRLWFYGVIRNDCLCFNNLSYTKHLRQQYMFFLFNRTTLPVFVTYLTGAPYVHTLWFYKHQHVNRVRSQTVCSMSAVMVSMTVLIRSFSSGIHTHPVSWNCAYHLRMELSVGGCFPNLVRNCRWIILARQSFWITFYLMRVKIPAYRYMRTAQ